MAGPDGSSGLLATRHASWQPWIWKSGNLRIWKSGFQRTNKWKLSECQSVLPKMSTRSLLVGEKNTWLRLGWFSTNLSMGRTKYNILIVFLFSLVVQQGPIYPVRNLALVSSTEYGDTVSACLFPDVSQIQVIWHLDANRASFWVFWVICCVSLHFSNKAKSTLTKGPTWAIDQSQMDIGGWGGSSTGKSLRVVRACARVYV